MSAIESLAIERLQTLINNALSLDPGTQQALTELKDQRIAIHTTFPAHKITISFVAESCIQLSTGDQKEADVTLQGSPIALATLLARASQLSSFAQTGVVISGNQEILQTLAKVMSQLEIDWEQAMAGVIGDLPAQLAGKAVRQALKFNQQAVKRATTGVAEFIREESGMTASATEASQWMNQISALAKDTDRISARIQKLKARATVNNSENT